MAGSCAEPILDGKFSVGGMMLGLTADAISIFSGLILDGRIWPAGNQAVACV
jgi:hypothetical protein